MGAVWEEFGYEFWEQFGEMFVEEFGRSKGRSLGKSFGDFVRNLGTVLEEFENSWGISLWSLEFVFWEFGSWWTIRVVIKFCSNAPFPMNVFCSC